MADFKDLQFREVLSYGRTVYVIYPADQDGLRKLVTVTISKYNEEKARISSIKYFDHDITDEDIKKEVGYYSASLKVAKIFKDEFDSFNIPEDFEAVNQFKFKIQNKTADFTDEQLTEMIFNNPRYASRINQDSARSINTNGKFYTMPKYEGKACTLSNAEINAIHNKDISYKEYLKWKEEYFYKYSYSYNKIKVNNTHSIIIAMKHPDYENGIIFYSLKYKVSVDKDTITHNVSCNYKIEHVPGIISKAIKYVKNDMVETTAFEAFNINSQNIAWNGNIQWVSEKDNDWKSFYMENIQYFEKSGFNILLKDNINAHGGYYASTYMASFLVIFVALLITYPVFELLIKMGYTKMFFDAYENMRQKSSKADIDAYVKTFEELVDNAATKGKMALRIPSYIGEHLRGKAAPVEEYFAWRDIYELENLSKEVFERIINSYQYAIFNFEARINILPNVLKYGYKFEKLLNFVIKKYMENDYRSVNGNSINNYLHTLGDYLHMCDMLDIEADLYPQDVYKLHNDIMILFKEKELSIYDDTFKKIATQSRDCVIPMESQINDEKSKISKMWKEYTVVFPDSGKMLINEGTQQHNCVGSYSRQIVNGECIIFFIRKKDDPEKSFITAECRNTGLRQCMYQNNRCVTEPELLNFARSVCDKLLTGVKSKKIEALGNTK